MTTTELLVTANEVWQILRELAEQSKGLYGLAQSGERVLIRNDSPFTPRIW